jgi:hypothetical protein
MKTRKSAGLALGMALAAGPVMGQEPKRAPSAPGDTTTDLVYTPVAPCRIADTRPVGGSLAPGVPRAFRVTGVGLDVQGGNSAGCDIPNGLASAVLFNFVAVNPTGPGNLRAWAYAGGANPPPNASILNYAQVPGLNVANGIALPICDVTAGACPQDLRVQADGNGAHVVVDVVGYFHRLATENFATFAVSAENLNGSTIGPTCSSHLQVTLVAPGPGRVVVQSSVWLRISHVINFHDVVTGNLATTPTECAPGGLQHSVTSPMPTASEYDSTGAFFREFTVGAGPHTFYLNAFKPPNPGSAGFTQSRLLATYYPEPQD